MSSASAFDRLVDELHATTGAQETRSALAKSLDAQRQGLLTGHDVAVIEALSNRGQPLPEVFRKALSTIDELQARQAAEHGAADENIAAAALDSAGKKPISSQELNKHLLEAQRAGRLRAGDMARAEAATNLGKPIPADVLKRILGGA